LFLRFLSIAGILFFSLFLFHQILQAPNVVVVVVVVGVAVAIAGCSYASCCPISILFAVAFSIAVLLIAIFGGCCAAAALGEKI